jgi:nucleoid DNA-binding protein
MGTMTKKKFINSISQDVELHPNTVRHVIQAFLDKMTECLSRGDRLEFRDFGVFEVVERKQKIGRNPKNASVPIVIPARQAVKFTPGKKMRKVIKTKPAGVSHHDHK